MTLVEEIPRRISIVGSTGSGKTYLARSLAQKLDLPLHQLDEIRRDSYDKYLPRDDFTKSVAGLVALDAWVIDGHYRDVRHLIWLRSELVVYLNYSPILIAFRLVSRFIRKRLDDFVPSKYKDHGDAQTDPTRRATERAGWSRRLERVSKTMRERREYSRVLDGDNYPDLSVLELKSPRAARSWLESLDEAGGIAM